MFIGSAVLSRSQAGIGVSDWNDVVGLRRPLAVSGPSGHQFAALFERITSGISPLGRIADDMGEGEFDYMAWKSGAHEIASPIAEGGAEAVSGDILAQAQHHIEHGGVGQPTVIPPP